MGTPFRGIRDLVDLGLCSEEDATLDKGTTLLRATDGFSKSGDCIKSYVDQT